MIVVDTNVISYLLIRGDRSEAIDRLLESDSEWVAPRLWLDEFLNVLATYERLGKLEPEDGSPILRDALSLMQDASYEGMSHKSLKLGGDQQGEVILCCG